MKGTEHRVYLSNPSLLAIRMSIVHTPTSQDESRAQSLKRKRFSTSSTSLSASPRPRKAPRTSRNMGLRRTESYITLPTVAGASAVVISSKGSCSPSLTVPYQQSLQYYKEQRQRRKTASRATFNIEPVTTRLEQTYLKLEHQPRRLLPIQSSSRNPAPMSSRSRPLQRTASLLDVTTVNNDHTSHTFYVPPSLRASSPLSPKRHLLPGRPVFPRSKREPNLYRQAIQTCMRHSSDGQKILQMGPRLAVSILSATKDLERIVAEQNNREYEMMVDSESISAESSNSWLDMRNDGLESVECGA